MSSLSGLDNDIAVRQPKAVICRSGNRGYGHSHDAINIGGNNGHIDHVSGGCVVRSGDSSNRFSRDWRARLDGIGAITTSRCICSSSAIGSGGGIGRRGIGGRRSSVY